MSFFPLFDCVQLKNVVVFAPAAECHDTRGLPCPLFALLVTEKIFDACHENALTQHEVAKKNLLAPLLFTMKNSFVHRCRVVLLLVTMRLTAPHLSPHPPTSFAVLSHSQSHSHSHPHSHSVSLTKLFSDLFCPHLFTTSFTTSSNAPLKFPPISYFSYLQFTVLSAGRRCCMRGS